MGEWKGRADFSVFRMDHYKVIIGLVFMKKIGVVPIPALNDIAILEKEHACMISTFSIMGKKLGAMQRVSTMRIVDHPSGQVAIKAKRVTSMEITNKSRATR